MIDLKKSYKDYLLNYDLMIVVPTMIKIIKLSTFEFLPVLMPSYALFNGGGITLMSRIHLILMGDVV